MLPLVTPSSSAARAPVETQNATRARSRFDGSDANNSSNSRSGMPLGMRFGCRDRNSPARSCRNGSIGLWCAFARRPFLATGNGLASGPVPASR